MYTILISNIQIYRFTLYNYKTVFDKTKLVPLLYILENRRLCIDIIKQRTLDPSIFFIRIMYLHAEVKNNISLILMDTFTIVLQLKYIT